MRLAPRTPPRAPADFGLAAPLTPLQAHVLLRLAYAGAIGPAFACEPAAVVMDGSPFFVLEALKRLGLVCLRDVAAGADPHAWAVRPGTVKRSLWWLSTRGAALAAEVRRTGLGRSIETELGEAA
jgi:hypothetical protein